VVSSPSIARKDLWDSGAIKSGADFRGRKIAVNVQGAFPEYLITLILDKYGMTLKDVDETVLGFPQQVIALQNKALDVALPPEPFPATAIAMGVAARIVPEQSVGSGDITTMVFFSGRFMRERPEVSKRFLRAILRAAHETQGNYNKNPELAAMLAHATKLKQDAVENSVATAFDPDLDIAKYEDSLRRQEAVYMKIGRLDYATPLPMDRLVDASLVHQATASLK
jgi:NitT/TauT family transport system substrate-binding protein